MKTNRVFLLCACVLLLSPALMSQTVVKADLSGEQEVPGVATNATGEAVFVVYADRIEYTLTARNFGTEVNASHIHLGPKGVNGPVMVTLFTKQTHGTFPGRVSGIILPTDLTPIKDRGVDSFSDLTGALIGGRTYTNIHTALAPPGEIRGQNLAIPEEQ